MTDGKTVGILISSFIILLIGVAFIQSISEQEQQKVSLITKTETISIAGARLAGGAINETYPFTLATGVANWRNDYSECIPTTIIYKNQSGGTLTDPTDYVFVYNTGGLTLKNVNILNSSGLNTTTASYSYCPDEYVGSWGKTVLNLIPGFFALALLGAGIYVAYQLLIGRKLE